MNQQRAHAIERAAGIGLQNGKPVISAKPISAQAPHAERAVLAAVPRQRFIHKIERARVALPWRTGPSLSGAYSRLASDC